jgi:lysophospholipase L1-like esterase
VTPFAGNRDSRQIAVEINQFNSVNREETKKVGAHYIDITPISREAVNDPSLIAGDGLHPSGKMYAEWVKLALPVVLEILDEEVPR